jgi:hypothetical protein
VADELKQVKFARLFSLRHDFPTEYQRLVGSPVGTEVAISATEEFPEAV